MSLDLAPSGELMAFNHVFDMQGLCAECKAEHVDFISRFLFIVFLIVQLALLPSRDMLSCMQLIGSIKPSSLLVSLLRIKLFQAFHSCTI